eukprot:UC1_evm1s764
MSASATIHLDPLDTEAYEALSLRKTRQEELPDHCLGRTMNRFKDILPNAVTRVRLSIVRGDVSSEYINANYIRGFRHHRAREYIAAQGPLPQTTSTFVRMLWERKVTSVVMLTRLVEKKGGRQRKKCEPYFPGMEEISTKADNTGRKEGRTNGKTLCYGGVNVTVASQEQRAGYTLTTLTLEYSGEQRTIRHYWYTSWPDH